MRRYAFFCFFLLCLEAAQAQDEVVRQVAKQLESSRSEFPGMRPHVFFSQDKYAPGDTAFFRLFILTESERILVERSLLTLELLNPNGSIVVKQNVSCAKFGAANQILLPDTLSPGVYEARLYSDRMNIAYGLTVHLMIAGEKKLIRVLPSTPGLAVFPEGGHVVTGTVNRLVIQSTGPLPSACVLRSDEGKIADVVFDPDGFGSVQFIPQKDMPYWIEYTLNGKTFSTPVPPSKSNEVTLRVYAGPRKTWVLDILSSPERLEEVFLVLVAQRQVFHAQGIQLNSQGRNQVLAASDFFPEGFSELFIFDGEKRILAYRPVHVPRRNPDGIEFSGVPPEVGTRENITAVLKLRDGTGAGGSGAFAVSVIQESTRLQPLYTPDPSVVLHADPPQVDWNQKMDRIEMELIARGIPDGVIPRYPPLVHRTNFTLSGRAYYADSTAMLPLLSKIVIYLHKDLIQYETGIDGRGNFEFSKIYDFFGSDLIYYKVIHLGKDLPRVRVDWSNQAGEYEPDSRRRAYVLGDLPDDYGILRKQKRAIDKSYGFFLRTGNKKEAKDSPNAVLEDEFQNADISINPKEYTTFETMQELILEVIPSLEFRKRQRDSTVRVTLMTHSPFVLQRYADGNPLYVIDGWITSNTNYLMSLSPRDIESVKIINEIGKLDKLENLARNGVLFIQTETPEKTEQDLTKDMFAMYGMSPTLMRASRYPDSYRVPDLRTTLYWNPQIETDSTGSLKFNFRTSDVPGKYWIRVTGTTMEGAMVTSEHSFEVKFKK